jgi:hypothetical protein
MKLEAIKGYSTNENVVFLQGDIVEVIGTEEGIIDLIGVEGWCEGIEMSFSPKVISEYFKYTSKR